MVCLLAISITNNFSQKLMNKKCILGNIPQGDLHVKILDLVAKRIDPSKEDLFFDKGSCQTCITHCQKSQTQKGGQKNKKSEIINHSKSNSFKKKEQDKKNHVLKCDKILRIGKQYQCFTEQSSRVKQSKQFPQSSVSSLSLQTKVVDVSIQRTSVIDKLKDIGTQYQLSDSEVYMLDKLRGQLKDKDIKIKRLEEELLNSQDYIKELTLDIESVRELARNKPYSDNHLINNNTLSSVGLQPSSLKELLGCHKGNDELSNSKVSIEGIFPFQAQIQCSRNDLLRMIVMQAEVIESQTSVSPVRADIAQKILRSQ